MIDSKLLVRYSKYVIPILTLFSLSKQVLYYYLFNIKIGHYIGIEEVLTPFIGDLLFYSITYLIPIILILLFWGDKITKGNQERLTKYQSKPFGKRLWFDIKTYWPFWFTQLIAIVIMIIKEKPAELILSTATFIPLIFLFYWIRKEAMLKHNIEFTVENVSLYNISSLLVVIFLMMISNTFSDVNRIKHDKTKKVTLVYNAKEIQCVDSLIYVGKTKGYTFIYNKKLKETEVLDNSLITKVIIDE